ncbi:hypothetical protein B842_08540 [Corynebacterium humireducens NBRC 106098 = DSM 45392]|uniref:Secreted protein n=1 Tax=Corynebacterium humireducens NBRC 106098 = DSM 45392 TaxID=1223515 RepID=A0A0B5D982_9CORY|nr:hypothetical protein B842_08540 [Corynebacterium humireducens NBRC 106098 = DSM 45392]
MTVKKTTVALALTVPLMFVAACGGGETAESTATGVPTAHTVTSTRTTETTTSTTSSEEETTSEEPTSEEPTEEPEPVEDPLSAPILEELYEEPEPVAAGHAASEADRAEIERLVRGIYEVETFHQFLLYVPENTCNEAVPQSMDLAGIPDQPLHQWDVYAAAQPHIASVEDIRVEGNHASAVVTAVSAGQSETRTQRYLHEDGRWKFCN